MLGCSLQYVFRSSSRDLLTNADAEGWTGHTAPPSFSSSLPTLPSATSSRPSLFIPGQFKYSIDATDDDYSGQSRRAVVPSIKSSSVTVADPVSFSCCLLEVASEDVEIKATNVRSFDGRVIGGIARHRASYTILGLSTHWTCWSRFTSLGAETPGSVGRSVLRSKRRMIGGQVAGGLLPISQSVGKLQSVYNLSNGLDL